MLIGKACLETNHGSTEPSTTDWDRGLPPSYAFLKNYIKILFGLFMDPRML
jgi:hypothetical protein